MLRAFSSFSSLACTSIRPSLGLVRYASNGRIAAPPMVYIKGEEMTRFLSQNFFSALNLCHKPLPFSSSLSSSQNFLSGMLVVCTWMSGLPLMSILPSGSSLTFLVALVMTLTIKF